MRFKLEVAEHVAVSWATQEAVWLGRLLEDLGTQMDAPTTIYEDNQGASKLAKNAKYYNRTKHIDTCHHFCSRKSCFQWNSSDLLSYWGHDIIADIMTKGLAKLAFEKLRDLLGVHDIFWLSCFKILNGSFYHAYSIVIKWECQDNYDNLY